MMINGSSAIRLVIVSILPEPVCAEIHKIQSELSEICRSVEALSYPPHITIRTGVIVPADKMPGFICEFGEIIGIRSPVNVKTGGLVKTEYMESGLKKYIVLYSVEKTERLVRLNRDCLTYEKYRKSGKKVFQPHISLAYEDLSLQGYEKVCRHIEAHESDYERTFEFNLNNVSLLYFSNGFWETTHSYQFGNAL